MSKNKHIPAISIIIPMYNMTKFIRDCLDSVLAQTFKNYEVIVVDDCSTDDSCNIVESYLPKFNGTLTLIKSEVNSGGCVGIPRNKAIGLARGKYIFFMDSDDAIISTAMEELYNLAEDFNVDVVHCEKYYRAPGETVTTDVKLLKIMSNEKVDKFVTKPTMVSDSLTDRVREFGEFKLIGYPWNRLMRRDLIVDNNILFPKTRCGDDHIFSFKVLCLAKKILRAPKPYYVYRRNSSSVTLGKLPADKLIHRWTDSLFKGTRIFDEFMDKFEVFRNKPEYKYLAFGTLVQYHVINLLNVYAQIPSYKLDSFVRKELSEVDGDTTALTAFLFNTMNALRVDNIRLRQQIKQLQEQQQDHTVFSIT